VNLCRSTCPTESLADSQQAPDSASNITAFKRNEQTDFDVIVVGAGLSGIGVGFHLQRDCPKKSYVILEGREALGGTWDLFRYPGIRSDSDMNTLGFRFRPWRGEKAIADGPSILTYLNDTAREYGIDRKIRYNHKVKARIVVDGGRALDARGRRPRRAAPHLHLQLPADVQRLLRL
jgi:cation diffusion facilitator CzcD-associated flavoprotein CzcO